MACSNLSLDSSAAGFDSVPSSGYHDPDSSTEAAASLAPPSPDAGGSPSGALLGSALCNYSYVAGASHNCQPDDPVQCALVARDAGPPASDAGAAYGDAGSSEIPGACHVTLTSGGAPTQACSAAGPGGNGDQCWTGADCGATFECVGSPGRCRHYCCGGDTSCTDGKDASFCDAQPVAWADQDAGPDAGPLYQVPVCIPVVQCSLLVDGACQPGLTCAIVKDDGTTSCVATGPQQVGDSCDVDRCASGLTCLGAQGSRHCYELCHVGSSTECPAMQTCTGSAQLFKDPAFGICQ